MKTIEITVDFIGRTTIQTKGFTGSDCVEASRSLEKALGLIQNDERTPEFFACSKVEQQVSGNL